MGVSFQVTDGQTKRAIASMSAGRAELFVALTHVAAKLYEQPVSIVYNGSDEWIVDAKSYCLLVEKFADKPEELLRTWAQYAAGMYDMIRNKVHDWNWPDPREHSAFRAIYYGVDRPD